MEPVTYRTPPVLHWFGTESRLNMQAAKKLKESALTAGKRDIAGQLKDAASAALSFGKGTAADIAFRNATEEAYVLTETAIERYKSTGRSRVALEKVERIVDEGNGTIVLEHGSGKLVIRPVAHLVRGRQRAPIGWLRNGVEVPYVTLANEIAARCGLEVLRR
ncbi:MAG: hypothetical protein AB7F50_02410 [Fimbriimonadaceae bacterium]